MMFSTFTYNESKGVGQILMNRPHSLNALDQQFFLDLNNLLDKLEESRQPPVLVITGAGKAFAAGADISEMSEMTSGEAEKFSSKGQRTLSRLEEYPMPVIAAINGYALGGGCELAMACDIRIASEKAKLGMPEASLGLTPGFGGTQRLPRLVGPGNALLLMLTCDSVSAQHAKEIGLVQQVCKAEELEAVSNNMAEKINSMGPNAIKTIKKVIRKGIALPHQDGYELESSGFAPLFENQGKTGMKAFLNKTKPTWKH